jgi:TonB family protein
VNWRIPTFSFFLGCFAMLILGSGLSSKPGQESANKLVEFYAIDVADVDFYPYWESEIAHVTKQADDTKLDYTYIASATFPCNAPAIRGRGRVILSLKVNQITGQVENAEVSSGHPLLVQSAVDNAKQWQFEPSQKLPEKITAVLNFSFHCGN